jgi:hypothetical protein
MEKEIPTKIFTYRNSLYCPTQFCLIAPKKKTEKWNEVKAGHYLSKDI